MAKKTVDDYIAGAKHWQAELTRLRKILAGTGLEETIKWGAPCYTHEGKNVVGLGAYKSYFGLWFYQGALLADKDGVLLNAQEGKTRALRQWRFTAASQVEPARIKAYVAEAIQLADQGQEIKPARGKALVLPKELRAALDENADAAAAFASLTPGRQREYADYVAEAKRADTRARRLAKILPMIQAGRGLNDRYR